MLCWVTKQSLLAGKQRHSHLFNQLGSLSSISPYLPTFLMLFDFSALVIHWRSGLQGSLIRTISLLLLKKIQTNLCSARCVAELHQLPESRWDILHENNIFFNRDSLILHALKYAIKHGDVGTVINILAHWMLMFHGTGKIPKYADALFHVLTRLKQIDSRLR